jgi:hypothetical protein
MDLKEIRWKGVGWIDLVQHRDKWWAVVNNVMNPQIRYNAGNFLTEGYLLLKKDSALWCYLVSSKLQHPIAHNN